MFKYIIKELNFLKTTSIVICIINTIYNMSLKLGLVLDDNDGVNFILELLENCVANQCCRFCQSLKNECHKQSSQNIIIYNISMYQLVL